MQFDISTAAQAKFDFWNVTVSGTNNNISPSVYLTGRVAGEVYNKTVAPGGMESVTLSRFDSADVTGFHSTNNDTLGRIVYSLGKYYANAVFYCGVSSPCRTNCTLTTIKDPEPVHLTCGTNKTYEVPYFVPSPFTTATLELSYDNPDL
jgi:hypothetical protein